MLGMDASLTLLEESRTLHPGGVVAIKMSLTSSCRSMKFYEVLEGIRKLIPGSHKFPLADTKSIFCSCRVLSRG